MRILLRRRAPLAENNSFRFVRDVQHLDLSPFDLVVTDFEPVSAWAARRRGVRSIGIGHQYASGLQYASQDNVTLHPANTTTFKEHLAASAGVICNSGFELISECLQWRKPVLTKPLQGQFEQLSNARALEQLG